MKSMLDRLEKADPNTFAAYVKLMRDCRAGGALYLVTPIAFLYCFNAVLEESGLSL